MGAFEKILSGIPDMDEALDYIRLGDNVVWRVSELDDFKLFMKPYLEQVVKDKRKMIYFRFASHAPLVEDRPEVQTITIPLSHRFETFTVEIHNRIAEAGKEVFYIFDCLSELQAAWATDLMMGKRYMSGRKRSGNGSRRPCSAPTSIRGRREDSCRFWTG